MTTLKDFEEVLAERIRVETLEEACKAQCNWCRGWTRCTELVNPIPYFIEKQYVPNCGEMKGWVHHQSWGGLTECDAGPIRSLLADALRRAAERDGSQ